MNFSIKLVTEGEHMACVNHGSTDEFLYELGFPTKGRKSAETVVICSGCLEALHTISGLGRQFGMDDFSPIEATITIPDKSRY
ncbi:hypothetical protein ABEV54_08795 [Peribacillus psychrosaccharolyticus]|uniref:hypothetical protein n=1 Tax=Peribacillus psychrosaccharolyticus TaxID=1407 RepID=UPI003D298D29